MKIILAAMLMVAALGPLRAAEKPFTLNSASFADRSVMPERLALNGGNRSPALRWTDPPPGTRAYVVTCIDLHPIARRWVHWFAVNLPSDTTGLAEGASGQKMPPKTVELRNSFGSIGYGGPLPPPGSGTHHYRITVYALNSRLELRPGDRLSEAELWRQMQGKILGQASITGLYSRS